MATALPRTLAVAFGLLFVSACSKSEADGPPLNASTAAPTATPALTTPWGTGPGTLSHDLPEEGSPEGPSAFAVDANGRIFVIDSVESVIEVFDGQTPVTSIPLPPHPFDDLELLGAERIALLELHQTPGITFLTTSGAEEGFVPFDPSVISAPSLITALVRINDELWVEMENEQLVRVATSSGASAAPQMSSGKLMLDGATLGVRLPGESQLEITQSAGVGTSSGVLATLDMKQRVTECTLLAKGPADTLLVGVRMEAEQEDPEVAPVESHALVSLDKTGKRRFTTTLPAISGLERSFRPVRMGGDGFVYAMTSTDAGVQIVKVKP